MKAELLTVREHARLTTSEVAQTLDQAQVSVSAFDWLCDLAARFRGRSGAQILQVEDRRWLRLDNYVGVLETPCGLRIEILPKHVDADGVDFVRQSRKLLRRMLEVAFDLPPRIADEAHLQQFDHPLLEWVMHRFLQALEHIVKRGVRRDYVRVEEEQSYLRGQLDVIRQMRQPPGRAHLFNIRHDVFSLDRAENRLLKAALHRVVRQTRNPDSWRLANELLHLMDEVPPSRDVTLDFRAWRTDRLMAHYQAAKPWCELVLGDQMPLALAGDFNGISLLFPMERLFESYVGDSLRKAVLSSHRMTANSSRHSLCEHEGMGIFRLKPDYLIEGPSFSSVLDAKWKLIDGSARSNNYEIAVSDIYQMFAYGHKYLNGSGDLALIYPWTKSFSASLPLFEFNGEMRLHVLPFDLEAGRILLSSTTRAMFGLRAEADSHITTPQMSDDGSTSSLGELVAW